MFERLEGNGFLITAQRGIVMSNVTLIGFDALRRRKSMFDSEVSAGLYFQPSTDKELDNMITIQDFCAKIRSESEGVFTALRTLNDSRNLADLLSDAEFGMAGWEPWPAAKLDDPVATATPVLAASVV